MKSYCRSFGSGGWGGASKRVQRGLWSAGSQPGCRGPVSTRGRGYGPRAIVGVLGGGGGGGSGVGAWA